MRNTPILTFINKLDREGMYPLDILADIEESLQIECAPLSWPIGMGKRFKGNAEGNLAYLASSEWRLGFVAEQWPEVKFLKTREHE